MLHLVYSIEWIRNERALNTIHVQLLLSLSVENKTMNQFQGNSMAYSHHHHNHLTNVVNLMPTDAMVIFNLFFLIFFRFLPGTASVVADQ